MRYIVIIMSLLANQAFAGKANQKNLSTTIENVTVFLQGAQINRTGKTMIKPGRSTIIIQSLSPHIDPKSIQVKGVGNFTILSVNHNFNYLEELSYNHKVDSLIEIKNGLENKIEINQSRIAVLKEKQSLLNANKNLGNELASATINELKQAVDFYDKTLMEILTEELSLKHKIKTQNSQLTSIRNQIAEFQNYEGKPTSEIKIKIESQGNTTATFDINYLVANAGWFPKYDLRVNNVDNPLMLNYKAEVHQNTGVDWNNVILTFSNGNPNQSGVAPELQTWFLNYERNTVYKYENQNRSVGVRTVQGRVTTNEAVPLPGVNIVVKGSTTGTVTDVNGYYSLTLPNNASVLVFLSVGYITQEIPITSMHMNVHMNEDITQLSEVVVTGYGGGKRSYANNYKPKEAMSVITTKTENQTTVEFEVKTPYSLLSNGDNLIVDLKSYHMETIYEYYAVPKLDKDAFLIARIINWDQFNLLEGEANLYFEDAYIGRSILNARSLTDTLDISLGRDKSIVIGREKVGTFTKRNAIGTSKIETRGFNIMARNKKSQSIHLTIFDQIPVAAINTIEVNAEKISGGALDAKTGEITWELDIEPQSQVDLELVYEVKYPRRENVDLE